MRLRTFSFLASSSAVRTDPSYAPSDVVRARLAVESSIRRCTTVSAARLASIPASFIIRPRYRMVARFAILGSKQSNTAAKRLWHHLIERVEAEGTRRLL